MNRNKYLLAAAVAAFGAQLLTATPALAQDDEGGLEEIVVTSQRREQALQDTPISVTAFTPERIREIGILGPQDLLDFVPNAMVSSGTGRGGEVAQFSIRGVNEARVWRKTKEIPAPAVSLEFSLTLSLEMRLETR